MQRLLKPALAALAGALAISTIGIGSAAASDSIRVVNVRGFSIIDNQHLVLNGGVSRHYLVTLRHVCPSMRFEHTIATSFGPTATIHSPHFEYIYTRDQDRRCYIDTIEHVESLDAARALLAERAEDEAAED
ncbi:MAG: DUF6491 family protein [Maricaulis sp.]|jgi:hypothetical protein|nr:DUF6491 family protein [Maricaulis sp.]